MAEFKLNYTAEEVQKKLDVVPTDSKPNQYIVTDGEGNAKWEDKLCWSEEGKVTLVEPFTEEYGEEVPNRNRFPLTLEEGKNYTVKWDGVEYDCTCFVDDWNRLVVGNASLMEAGANTNEPFLVGVQDGDSFVKAQTGGDHELSIFGIGETIHPIDKKYLPSGGGLPTLCFTVDWDSSKVTSDTEVTKALEILSKTDFVTVICAVKYEGKTYYGTLQSIEYKEGTASYVLGFAWYDGDLNIAISSEWGYAIPMS